VAIAASIKVIKYLSGPHDHYMCIGSQISQMWDSFPKLSTFLGISNTQNLLDLKKLLTLQYILFFSSHHNMLKMTQPVLPTTNLIWFCELLVYKNMCFNFNNISVWQFKRKRCNFFTTLILFIKNMSRDIQRSNIFFISYFNMISI